MPNLIIPWWSIMTTREFLVPMRPFLLPAPWPGVALQFLSISSLDYQINSSSLQTPILYTPVLHKERKPERRKFGCLALFSITLSRIFKCFLSKFRNVDLFAILSELCGVILTHHTTSSTLSHSELSPFPSQTISSSFIALHHQGWNVILLFCLKSFTSFLSQKNAQTP